MRNNSSSRINNSYTWIVNQIQEQDANVEEIAKALNLPLFIVSILFNRGYTTLKSINDFLNPSLAQLHQPKLLPDLEKAVSRIIKAIESKEQILIYGDYDVDGVTSTALLLRALRTLGASVSFYIPNRQREGYGLSETGILYAKSKGFNLIVTVDCGTTDFVEIDLANKSGIDVIVCDHHETKEILPDAYAIVNPKRTDSSYPFSDLSGVGVVFKLIWALFSALNQSKQALAEHLDLVALGTIADIVPLIDENRVLAYFGLKQIAKTNKIGLQSLLKVTGLLKKEITTYDIGFIIGPRINASGRLSGAEKVVTLLTTENKTEADIIAKELNQENASRQKIETEILDDVVRIIDQRNLATNKVLVLGSEKWHEGVVGIVASRIVERYFRPTILLSIKQDQAKGSGRSIPGFNIYQALTHCQDFLMGFGGHKYACGVVLPKDGIEQFSQKMQKYAQTNLGDELLQRKLYVDARTSLHQITNDMLDIIKQFEPFGQDNPGPVFMSQGLEIVGYPRRVGKDHLKFTVRENKTKVLEAIAYGRSEEILNLQKGKEDHLDIVYTFDEHSFAGKTKLQLVVRDLKIH
jgi:single-stranded-DNA-specific exonuclease